jgi:hypothetical protein
MAFNATDTLILAKTLSTKSLKPLLTFDNFFPNDGISILIHILKQLWRICLKINVKELQASDICVSYQTINTLRENKNTFNVNLKHFLKDILISLQKKKRKKSRKISVSKSF